MNVIKKKALNLNIPTVSGEVLERWRNRGIEIGDAEGRCASDNIQLLIGVDFANKFLRLRPSGGDIPVPVRSPKSSTVERG